MGAGVPNPAVQSMIHLTSHIEHIEDTEEIESADTATVGLGNPLAN